MKKKTLALVLLTSFCSFPAGALEMKGVHVADTFQQGDKTLVLNGAGMRQKTFLNIDVYIGALYLEAKSQDAQAILNSPGNKRVELAFVHSASQGQLQDAFEEAYKNCPPDCAALKVPFSKLKSLMMPIQVGDRLAFDISPGKVDVWLKGQSLGVIEDATFSRAFLRTWLGEYPPTESLKKAMLGK